MDLNEAKKRLERCLNDVTKRQYFTILRDCLKFRNTSCFEEFDMQVRKLLETQEQKYSHHLFLVALKTETSSRLKNLRVPKEPEPVQTQTSSSNQASSEIKERSAAVELFIPNIEFMVCRVALACWNKGLDAANQNVAHLMVEACQVFMKNIITAMISRKKGYKIRDRKLQYGFNQPIPNPIFRNYWNINDETQHSKVEVEEGLLLPKCKMSLEETEWQTAFAYSCANRKKCESTLTLSLLYETIKDNPKLLGLHSIHSVGLFKLGLEMDNNL